MSEKNIIAGIILYAVVAVGSFGHAVHNDDLPTGTAAAATFFWPFYFSFVAWGSGDKD